MQDFKSSKESAFQIYFEEGNAFAVWLDLKDTHNLVTLTTPQGHSTVYLNVLAYNPALFLLKTAYTILYIMLMFCTQFPVMKFSQLSA